MRSGLVSGDSGSFVVTVAGDSFVADYDRLAGPFPGALRVTVRPASGGPSLAFEPATAPP